MLRKALDLAFTITERSRYLKRFKPVLTALDAALFGTDKVTAHTPHIADNIDMKRFMSMVIIALLPATLASVYCYGFRAIEIILVSYIMGGIVEVAFAVIRKKEIEEGFLVTGLIFALTLPPSVPLWVVSVGITFGVFFGKEVFGGTGRNIFNPALVGRLFITLAFPSIMSLSWQEPFTHVITSATPLIAYKSAQAAPNYVGLLLGAEPGCLGETFRAGLLFGGIFLMFTRISNWRIPAAYLGVIVLFSYLGNKIMPSSIAPPGFQLLSGGLLLGAMFMATDPVTSPFTAGGKYVFGGCCGLLTLLIRSFSGYTEGVMFSIILMNTFTPLMDHVALNLRYKPAMK